MKIKDGFILRKVSEAYVVIATGEAAASFNGMITLNESGLLLWKRLEQGATREELIALLTEEYEVGEEIASADVDKFLLGIGKSGCIEMQ